MMNAYHVYGMMHLGTYTTRQKAERVVREHPLLELTIQEYKIPFFEWLFLKSIFR